CAGANLSRLQQAEFEKTRRPYLHGTEERKTKIRRSDAYDGERLSIEFYAFAEYAGLRAEARTPKRVTDHDNRLASGFAFLRQKRASQLRPNSEHLQESGRDTSRRELLRISVAGHDEAVIGERRDGSERAAVVA